MRPKASTQAFARASQSAFAGDVGFEARGAAALLLDHRLSLLRGVETVIHAQHAGAFARHQERRGTPVPDRVPRRLAGADHGRDLAFEPHFGNPSIPSSSCTPSVLSAIDTRLYWPTVKTRSISCSVL